ncbi:MAG: Hypoxanthine phosphoribosyltransferase [Candidatus Anoxychlamydiales bacterium]|nr:Hypoxanthine phosphoribosyltransferase [Candidatus Anoxychlamydiales bacterium]
MNLDSSKLKLLISEEDIKTKIVGLANKLDLNYQNSEVTILMILKGSFIFIADLIREMKSVVTIDTISATSYGKRGSKKGNLLIEGIDKLDLENKNVLVIDDIFDSGNTMNSIVDKILEKNPKSVKSLTLLLKNTKNRLKNANLPDFHLFEIEDKFVIGYGLDYSEYHRNLKSIYYIEN